MDSHGQFKSVNFGACFDDIFWSEIGFDSHIQNVNMSNLLGHLRQSLEDFQLNKTLLIATVTV